MAKRKPEEPKKGAPEWQCTFSDLMNLLLCFFVLLFSMSSVDANKWEQVVASMSGAFSIFNSGSTAIGNAAMVGMGTAQLNNLDEYYNEIGQTSEDTGEDPRDTSDQSQPSDDDLSGGKTPDERTETGGNADGDDAGGRSDSTETGGKTEDDENQKGGKTLAEQLAEAGRIESEEMLDKISEMTERYNISDSLELSMDAAGKYVEITLSGSLLFDSGSAELKESCLPLLSKVGDILTVYSEHSINIIGHTDNVPMKSSKFESNEILSSARAISAAEYLVENKGIDIRRLSWTGRGEYEPIASNSTAEGRARNRRIEIRIYNSLSSN